MHAGAAQDRGNTDPTGFTFLRWGEVGLGVLEAPLGGVPGTEELSERERALFEVLPSHRQPEWLRGRRVCKQVARELLGPDCAPRQVEVLPGPQGEPRLRLPEGVSPLAVSLSHARALSVVAVAPRGRVGVDVEPEAPIPERLWHLFLTPAERARCEREPGLASRLWLLKEALYKALRPPTPVPLLTLEPELGEGVLRLRQPVAQEFAFTFLASRNHLLALVYS
jgi:4'-phosphopantetheinyl transferase